MTIDELIAKLEAATEGSRELDLDVARAAFPELGFTVTTEGVFVGPILTRISPYTTSLDAAMTLVPDSCLDDISLDLGLGEWSQKASGLPPCMVMLATGQLQNPKTRQYIGRSKRPALALCIAALKARTA